MANEKKKMFDLKAGKATIFGLYKNEILILKTRH